MAQQACTGRETASLEEVIEQQDDAKDEYHHVGKLWTGSITRNQGADIGTEPKGIVGYGTEQKAYCHMVTRIHAVGHEAIEETADTIDHRHKRHDDTETGLCDAILGAQTGDGKREVLANEIEQGIAYHRDDDGAPLPIKEAFVSLHCLIFYCVVCCLAA